MITTNVLENSTDVQEDVWEKHVKLVLELHVLEKLLKRNAEELVQEDVENFTCPKDKENPSRKLKKRPKL